MGIILDLAAEKISVDYEKRAEKKLHIVMGDYAFLNQTRINIEKESNTSTDNRSRVSNVSFDFATIYKQRFENGFFGTNVIEPTILQLYSFQNVIQKNTGAVYIEELVQKRFYHQREKITILYFNFEKKIIFDQLLQYGWSQSFIDFILENCTRRGDAKTTEFHKSQTITKRVN